MAAAPLFATFLPGPVLDLACGLGQNALWLATLGQRVIGVDASAEAVRRARAEAKQKGLDARFEAVRLEPGAPFFDRPCQPWGAVIVFHFLDRSLMEAIGDWVAPGGILAYKTHLRHKLRPPGTRPRRPAYLLEPGELLLAFRGFTPLAYREWIAGPQAFAALLARRLPGHSS